MKSFEHTPTKWLAWGNVVVIFLTLPLAIAAQATDSDTLKAYQYFQRADSLQMLALNDTSNYYFTEAAAIYTKAEAWERVVECYLNLSLNHLNSGSYEVAGNTIQKTEELAHQYGVDNIPIKAKILRLWGQLDTYRSNYASALAHYEEGLSLLAEGEDPQSKVQANLMYYRGDVYGSQGKYDQALEQFFKALDIYNRLENPGMRFVSRVHNNIGIIYKRMGQNDTAREYFQKSIELDKQLFGPDHPDVAAGLNNIAILHYYEGDYQQALDYMKEATNTLSTYWGEKHPQVATGYNNISIVYSEMGELEHAIRYMERAIAIRKEVIGEENFDVAVGYQNLGALYYDLEEYDRAIENYQVALNLHQKIFDDGHPQIANIYANLGEAYSEKKEYGKALQFLQKDLAMNTQLLGGKHPFIADTHTKIGRNYQLQGDPTAAIQHYEKAISILTDDASGEAGIQDLTLEGLTHPVFLMEALQNKAKAHRTIFRETSEIDHLREAQDTYLVASSLIEEMLTEYSSDESRLMLGERADEIFRSGVETAYSLYEETEAAEQIRYLLYFAEQGKAQVLLRHLVENNAQSFAGIPDSLVQRERQLRESITDLHEEVRAKVGQTVHIDSVQTTVLQDSIYALKRQLNSHISNLEQNYPNYYQLKYQRITAVPEQIQEEVLEPDQSLIEYVMSDEALYALVINRQNVSMHKMDIDSSLSSDIRQYRKIIMEEDADDFKRLSHNLYRQFFQPIHASVDGNSLIIVPDGILNYLPFETLTMTPADNNAGFSSLSYLLKEYKVSYAPSIKFLNFWNQHNSWQSNSSKYAFLGFAPVFSSFENSRGSADGSRYSPPVSSLPLSRYEVEKVDSLMDEKGHSSQIFLNSNASERTFRNQALQQFNIIHLATHAFTKEDSLGRPGIHFTNEPGVSEDGILRLDEIYNLNLRAKLVVLSACETALGNLVAGEGVMSLARAFQFAGTQNLFVSLWQVDDRSTSELMIGFYQQLLEEATMREAVRQAKLQLMEQPRYASPRFWASFVLLGK